MTKIFSFIKSPIGIIIIVSLILGIILTIYLVNRYKKRSRLEIEAVNYDNNTIKLKTPFWVKDLLLLEYDDIIGDKILEENNEFALGIRKNNTIKQESGTVLGFDIFLLHKNPKAKVLIETISVHPSIKKSIYDKKLV